MEREKLENLARYSKLDGKSIFSEYEARDSIYETSESFVREVKERGIKNIILPDSSARPLWVGFSELWHIKYPDERLPGIFFLNPDGFHVESSLLRQAKYIFGKTFGHQLPDELMKIDISPEKIEKFKKTFSVLMEMKDEPTLILDTCIHTGETMKVVLEVLEQAGFSNINTAAVSEDHDSVFSADFYLLDHEPYYSCYPAGPEGLVEKSEDIVSQKGESEIAKEFSRQTREEIKAVIRERAGEESDI